MWVVVVISIISTIVLIVSWSENNTYTNTRPAQYAECLTQSPASIVPDCANVWGTNYQNSVAAQGYSDALAITVPITIVGWIVVVTLNYNLKELDKKARIAEIMKKPKIGREQ